MRSLLLALIATFASARYAQAWDSPAPDVVLYCLPTLQAPCARLAAAYRSANDIDVHLFTAPPAGLIGLLQHRARADVVVADTPTLQTLAAAHLVNADTMVPLGGDPFILAGRPAPGDASHDVATLAASHTVILTDPTTAASFDGHAILSAALGQHPAPQQAGVPDTPYVLAGLRDDGDAIGLVTRTDTHGAGIFELARLNVPPMQISGAVVTLRQSVNSPQILAFIAGPQGAAIRGDSGLDVIP
jgi:Bacterial extracellular solute-binding protein